MLWLREPPGLCTFADQVCAHSVSAHTWQSALFGAAAAGWLALVSLVVRSGRNVVSALRVASVPSGVGVWSLDGATHDISKLPSQYPFGSVRLLLAPYLRHVAVRLVGRSRSGRRVPRLRSRCATAFPKLRRHPRPSQKRRRAFGLRPLKVRSCSPALGVHSRTLACGRPLSPAQTAHASIRECPLAYGCLPSPRRAPPTRWQRRLPMDHSGEQRRGGSCSRTDPSSGTTCRSDERRLPSDRPRPSHLELRSGLPERNRNAMGSAGQLSPADLPVWSTCIHGCWPAQ